jgi:hypothetical protein
MYLITVLLSVLLPLPLLSQTAVLKGRVTDPKGNALPNASVKLLARDRVLEEAVTGLDGKFQLKVVTASKLFIRVEAFGFRPVTH